MYYFTQGVRGAFKAQKICRGQEARGFHICLEKHKLLCLYSLLDVATTLKVFKLSERVLEYTHLVIFKRQGTKQPVFDKDRHHSEMTVSFDHGLKRISHM